MQNQPPTTGEEPKIKDYLRGKFVMDINKKRFEVYPTLETMVDKSDHSDFIQYLNNLFENRSVPIARRIIIT